MGGYTTTTHTGAGYALGLVDITYLLYRAWGPIHTYNNSGQPGTRFTAEPSITLREFRWDKLKDVDCRAVD